jgi:type II secretion system protein G
MKTVFDFQKKQLGFTLIELLVAISIIGILSSILFANFIGARQRARDGQRKQDIGQIQAALEFYKADKGYYPQLANAQGSFPNPAGSCNPHAGAGEFNNGVAAPNTVIYMRKVPCDPSGSYYIYAPNGNPAATYNLTACLENAADAQADNPKNGGCATTASFTVTNP